MKTIQIQLYQFEELSPDAQQTAIDNDRDINVDHDWWDGVYDDADQIGLGIKGFDLGRANNIDVKIYYSDCEVCANKIREEHGEHSDTYKAATEFLQAKALYLLTHTNDEWDEEEEGGRTEADFLRALKSAYLNSLKREYEYLTGDDAIRETLIANECDFTEDGKIYWRRTAMQYLNTKDLEDRRQELEDEKQSLIDNLEELDEQIRDYDGDVSNPDEELKDLLDRHELAIEALQDWEDSDDGDEFNDLEALKCEIYNWSEGETLIPADNFTEHCQDLCENIGYISRDVPWFIVIDWDATAENIKADYTEVTYQGDTYYVRNT